MVVLQNMVLTVFVSLTHLSRVKRWNYADVCSTQLWTFIRTMNGSAIGIN